MEDFDVKKNGQLDNQERDIVYSQSIKAGRRIYYLDVKKTRYDELYLAITESKKTVSGEGENVHVNFEKHKIFLYREDLEKFANGLADAIGYIIAQQGVPSPRIKNVDENSLKEEQETSIPDGDAPIKIDIDF